MKNVFYPHIILLVEGRFLTLFFSIFPLCCMIYTIWLFIVQQDVTFLTVTVGIGVMEVGGIWVSGYFWRHSWGKLIVTDTAIVWKCLFLKTVKLDISEIKDVSTVSFSEGNAVKFDLYNTGFRYIILSETNIPYVRVDKIKCKRGIIKFQHSDRLRELLQTKLPRKLGKRL